LEDLNLSYVRDNIQLISPDAGANKNVYDLAKEFNITTEIITCSKHRDVKNSKILKTVVPYDKSKGINKKPILIIDDLCDGGFSFINIAKAIKESGWNEGKIYLLVTHGIFSKGFDELNQYFDKVYTTNSYQDIPDNYTNGIEKFKTNVKQLTVI